MDTKTLLSCHPAASPPNSPSASQSDTAFTETAKGLAGPRPLLHRRPLRRQELAAILELAHAVKTAARRLPPRPRRQADGPLLREGLAPHAPHLRGRHEHRRRQRHLRRPDQGAARRARIHPRRRPQPRALDARHRPAHLLARHHHRDGRQRRRPRHQRALRPRAPLPGHRRLHDPRRTLRRVEGLKFTYVGDGNNVCHSLMLARRSARRAHDRRHARRNFAPSSTSSTRPSRSPKKPAAPSPSPTTPSRPPPEPTPSTPTSAPPWARSRSRQARPHLQALPGQRRADGAVQAPPPSSCTACPAHRGAEVTDAVLDRSSSTGENRNARSHHDHASATKRENRNKCTPSNKKAEGESLPVISFVLGGAKRLPKAQPLKGNEIYN